MATAEEAKVCKGIMVFIVTLVFSIVLGLSFSLVSPTEVAMRYNPNTKFLDQATIWENGRHMVLPGSYFFLYPLSLINMLFMGDDQDIECWTQDKQELKMELAVQVRIAKNKISDIFEKYGCEDANDCSLSALPVWINQVV